MRDSVRRISVSTSFLNIGLAIAATLLLDGSPRASAATIAFTGFEPTGSTWLGMSLSGAGSISTTTGAGQFPEAQRIFEGLRSYQGNNGLGTIDFDPVDVSAFETIQITLHVSSTARTSGNGNDGQDFIKLYVAINGAAFSLTPDITLTGGNNALWGYDGALTASTVAGTPRSFTGTDSSQYATMVISIPNTAQSVDFRIETQNDNVDEYWNIDAVSLTGTAVPEPSVGMSMIGGVGILCGLRRMRRFWR